MKKMPKNISLDYSTRDTMKRLLKILFKHFKWKIILSMICIILTVTSNLAVSVFLKRITEIITEYVKGGIVQNYAMTQIAINIVIMALIYAIGIFSIWYYNRTMAIVTHEFLNKLRIDLFNHMETLPIKFFDQHPHGDIMSIYTNDIDTIRQFVSQCIPSLFSALIATIGCLIVMLLYSLWLTLVMIGGSLVMIVVTKKVGGKAAKYFVKQQTSLALVEGNIQEAIKGLKVIKVFSHEQKSLEQFNILNEELFKNSTEANIRSKILGPIMMNLGHILYVLTAIIGCCLIIYGGTNVSLTGIEKVEVANFIPIMVAFLAMSRTLTNQMNTFAQQITFIIMGSAGAARCFQLLDEKSEEDNGYVTLVNVEFDKEGKMHETDKKTNHWAWKHPHKKDGTTTFVELKGDVILDHVDFGYIPEKLVLKDVSVYAHPGQKVAFVGSTGAGKTTITNLINRFYTIDDGKIRYDGININKIKLGDLRRSLGMVLQDTNLFTGTVMENIRYGRLDATDEECIEASKIANAYDFIIRLPDGFNTVLTADGANLSQGQRQLLSIARAAVADAPLMILDEATSSIDTRTEKLVQQGTDKLMEGRTVFVIAHRLSTVQNSDCIIVLEHGQVIEKGTHQELIAQKGVYYQLYTGAFELE